MNKKYLYIMALVAIVMIPMLVSHCSGDKGKSDRKTEEKLPQYENFTTYTYRTFVFHFRRDASWRDDMYQIAKTFESALKKDCEFFQKPCPEGPIHVYIYNTPKEAKTLLGRDTPYVVDDQIHWERILTPYGAGLMMYLLKYWDMKNPEYDAFKEGLIALRDFSKRNYHQITGRFIVEGIYIPLDSLLNNTVYMEHERQVRSWEAASLVAFITLNLGVDAFLDIWNSDRPLSESLEKYAHVDQHKFEQLWNQYTVQEYENWEKQNQNKE